MLAEQLLFGFMVVIAILLLVCYCNKNEQFYETKLKLQITSPPTVPVQVDA